MNKIAILGTGNMGKAIIGGLIQNKTYLPQDIYATRRHVEQIKTLQELGVETTSNNKLAVKNAQWIIIAVKPHIVGEILNEIKDELTSQHVIISIATGYTINTIRAIVGVKPKIYRAMPNTATSVGEGVTCICSQESDPETTPIVQQFFNHLGTTVIIEEKLMDAATVISACGEPMP